MRLGIKEAFPKVVIFHLFIDEGGGISQAVRMQAVERTWRKIQYQFLLVQRTEGRKECHEDVWNS